MSLMSLFAHLKDGQEMDREEVDGEHDDDGDQHLGHLPPRAQLVVEGSIRRIQPEIKKSIFIFGDFHQVSAEAN
jgi:hypothetical protein